MRTPDVYLTRADAARNAAQTIARAPLNRHRADDVRAQRLAEYAQLCATLARRTPSISIADGLLALAVQDSANAAARYATELRDRRRALSGVRIAARMGDRRVLADALVEVATSRVASESERGLATSAYLRLGTLIESRPALDALSWRLVRALHWDAEIVERLKREAETR